MQKKVPFLIVVCLLVSLFVQAQQLRVATYNMRNDNNSTDAKNGNGWKQRYPVIASLIRFHDFDIFGTQECLHHQILDLLTKLPGYAYVGIGRDDGKEAGEYSAVFYKTTHFTLLDKGNFWLSQTPDKPSLGWDATCCNRICSWAYLQDKKTGKKFYVFNAHYDYQKDLARNESSKLILKKIREIAGNKPVMFMGDLNGGNESNWYKILASSGTLKDTYKEAPDPYTYNPTFQDFGKLISDSEIIDHIFVSQDFSVSKWGILSDTYHGKYPSDHFPVMAVVDLNQKQ
jgi:endonuclease/exonuclease/phosphatase family metal-dependent hydrolase